MGLARLHGAAHTIAERLLHLHEARHEVGVGARLVEIVMQRWAFELPHGVAIPIGFTQKQIVGWQRSRAN